MKLLSIAALVCACVVAMASAEETREYDVNKAEELFEKFIKDFDRKYKDDADKQLHYEAFVKNLASINESNRNNPTATYGINKFADYTEHERKHLHGLRHN